MKHAARGSTPKWRTTLVEVVALVAHKAAGAWRATEQWLATSSTISDLLDAASATTDAAKRAVAATRATASRAAQESRRRPTTTSILGNLALIATVAALGVMVLTEDSTTPSVNKATLQGAQALGADPASYQAPDHASGIVPDPLAATDDAPAAYAQGCQVQIPDSKPVVCEFGDSEGNVEVALVGDSKALQWISAIDTIGQRQGWHVQSITKSACSFSATSRMVDGERYKSCDEWNEAVRSRLLDDPPDMVITSQRTAIGMNNSDDVADGESRQAMADGLHERWQELIDAGSTVAVLRDNPSPSGGSITNVYECVAEHSDDLERCSFSRSAGEEASAGDTQLLAADMTPDAHVLDLNDYICPRDTCPPVIGGVLVYRQGSHITQTYIDSLADQLESELVPLVSASGAN